LYMFGSISIRPCEAVNVWTMRRLQGAVHGAAAPPRAAFPPPWGSAPQVGDLVRGPFVRQLAHRRRRRDRVHGADFAEPVGDPGGRFVTVEADHVGFRSGHFHDLGLDVRSSHAAASVATISMALQGHCRTQAWQPVQRS
jgi:hypothetical protein